VQTVRFGQKSFEVPKMLTYLYHTHTHTHMIFSMSTQCTTLKLHSPMHAE